MPALRIAASGPAWHRFCPDVDAVPVGLRLLLDADHPIALTSRFSSPTGANARTSAINSFYEAARELKRQSTIDLVDHLPSREALDLRLKTAPVVRSKRLGDGKDIQHSFVQLDLRPEVPVVLLIATGSGKLAAEGFIQPFVQRLAELIWEQDVALLCTKRWDRAARNEDLAGPILMAMERRGTWLCTDDLFRPMDDLTRMMLMMDGFASRTTTGDSDEAKRKGQADRTGRCMVDGRVAYHLPSAPAPGMGVATMKRRPDLEVEKIAYLDTPACRPDAARVADGLSEVVGEDGQIVDQVANVRFFLTHFGKQGWMDDDRLPKELSRRRFSTVHVRGRYGADCHVTTSRGHTAWHSILDNLDVYETGVLRRSVGGEVGTVEIAGVLPPDGPWATPKDFARIRAYVTKGKQRAGARVRLPLSGISATYDGIPVRTRSVASPSTVHEDVPCLAFNYVLDSGHETRVNKHVLLPWGAFAESLADAIVAAGAEALVPLLDQVAEAGSAAAAGPEARLAEVKEQLTSLQRRKTGLRSQLGETDPDGKPVLRGAFLAAAQEDYEELDRQVSVHEQHRDALLAQQQPERRTSQGAAEPKLLPHLLASLRDPGDHTYTPMWRRIIAPLTFTTGPSEHPGAASRVLTWRGAIRIDAGGDGTVVIPFEGSYDYRRVAAVHDGRFIERQHAYVAAMLRGVPYHSTGLPARHANRPRVARLLGIDVGHPLFDCDDPRIVAAATAMLLHEQDGSVAVPDGDAGFLAAVRHVHVDDRTARSWRRPYGVIVTAFYDLAAATGTVMADDIVQHCRTTKGTVHTAFSTLRRQDPNWTSRRKQGYLLAPCANCGSHDRRPAEIAEIHGLLCRNCGVDEAGNEWGLEPYGRYLA